MKFNLLLFAIISIFLISCDNKKAGDKRKDVTVVEATISKETTEDYMLFKNNCYACHSVTAKSHDDIIAPPMVAVKRRYMVSYKTKEEFVDAMINWVIDPKEENALMRGAVKQFKVMPKQPFDKDVIAKIAKYIFENEIEKPEWFESHFEEEHPEGMGNGQGRGRGMGNKKINN